jgi:hypothetical protein
MTFMQGVVQLEYLLWKYEQLKRWCNTPPTGPLVSEFGGQIYRFSTRSHPVFTAVFNAFYPDGRGVGRKGANRKITDTMVEWIDDLALAVWFMDDGSQQRGQTRFSTIVLGEDQTAVLAGVLCSRGIEASAVMDVKGWGIRLKSAGTDALFQRIEPHIHPALRYKLERTGHRTGAPDVCPVLRAPMRTCVICGAEFSALKSATTCGSEKCRKRLNANLVAAQKRRKPPVMETVSGACVVCNQDFKRQRKASREAPPLTCSRSCQAKLGHKQR